MYFSGEYDGPEAEPDPAEAVGPVRPVVLQRCQTFCHRNPSLRGSGLSKLQNLQGKNSEIHMYSGPRSKSPHWDQVQVGLLRGKFGTREVGTH